MQALTGQSSIPSISHSGLACPVVHKERCQIKSTITQKESNSTKPATQTNNNTPHGAELDKLAKAWCELVLGFMQETNLSTSSQVPLHSSQGKIDIGRG